MSLGRFCTQIVMAAVVSRDNQLLFDTKQETTWNMGKKGDRICLKKVSRPSIGWSDAAETDGAHKKELLQSQSVLSAVTTTGFDEVKL